MFTATVSEIYNYRQATPDLATSGQPREEQLHAIAAAGYEVVVNLALHEDPRYSLKDEASSVRGLGIEYVHIPVQFDAPTERDLALFFETMDRCKNRRVWVHCAANMRVTACLGLYWRLREGWPEQRAFALMRDVWHPNPVWSTFIATHWQSKCRLTCQKYAMRRPHVITAIQTTMDSTAAARAATGASAATFHAPTERYGTMWKKATFNAAVASSASFSRNAGLVANSVACAVNIMSPAGTTSASPAHDQRSRWLASAVTGRPRPSPSTRKSNITTAPTRITKPTIWTISTIGYIHADLRIVSPRPLVSSQTSHAGPRVGAFSAIRPFCRRL